MIWEGDRDLLWEILPEEKQGFQKYWEFTDLQVELGVFPRL